MQEPHKKGLANHLDPGSCAGGREVAGEALTGAQGGPGVRLCSLFLTAGITSRENSDICQGPDLWQILRSPRTMFPCHSWPVSSNGHVVRDNLLASPCSQPSSAAGATNRRGRAAVWTDQCRNFGHTAHSQRGRGAAVVMKGSRTSSADLSVPPSALGECWKADRT